MNIYIKLLTINLLLIQMGCNTENKTSQKEIKSLEENSVVLTKDQAQFAQITTVKLNEQTLDTELKLTGKIDVPPQNLIAISAPNVGILQKTSLLPGMPVRKGQIIATISDPSVVTLQQDYLNLAAKLEYLKLELARQQELNQNQANSTKILQQTQLEYQNTNINLASQKAKLKLIKMNPEQINAQNIQPTINIYSPINGFVNKVMVNIGKYVSPSEILFELIDPSDIHLNLKVFEKDLSNIKLNQKIMASTNNNPDVKHPCEVILISKSLDADGSTEVHCHFLKYEPELVPGMFMNASLTLQSAQVNVLPENCIQRYEGKNYIFIEKSGNNYEMIAVEVGKTHNGFIEILNDKLLSNKNIVQNGAYTLLMKLKNTEEE